MKNVKYRAESFSPFDLQGTEAHLSAMAAQGWRLESIGRCLWKYRRVEPAGVRYAAACPPAASGDGHLGDRQFYEDLCAAAGWEKVCDWAELQIYANETPAPVPLETDEALRLESVHRSMRRTYLQRWRNTLLSYLLLFLFYLAGLWAHPHTYLLSNVALGIMPTLLLMAFAAALSIAGYFSWYRRSLRSVEEGGVLAAAPRYYRAVNRLPAAALLLLLLLLLVPLDLTSRDRGDAARLLTSLAACGLGVALGVSLGWGAKRFTWGRDWDGYSRGAAAILGLLALLAVLSGLAQVLRLDQPPSLETPSYEWNGESWDLEPQPIPLTAEDLTGEDWPHVKRIVQSQGRTLLASESSYAEFAAQEDGTRAFLHCAVTDVPNGRLCRAVFRDIQNSPSYLEYRPGDPGPWGAEAAYRLCPADGGTSAKWDGWLVLWPGRVLEVYTEGLDLGAEEIAVIAARLAPEA